MTRVPASMHRATMAMSFLASGGAVNCARADRDQHAVDPDHHCPSLPGRDGRELGHAIRCVRLTTMSPTVCRLVARQTRAPVTALP
jgi:hypothetical protein